MAKYNSNPRVVECTRCSYQVVTRKPYGYALACSRCHKHFTDREAEDLKVQG